MRKLENHTSSTPDGAFLRTDGVSLRTDRVFLGVDGGGTRTQACVVDAKGEVLGWGLGGPSNLNYVPEETVIASLGDAVSGALKKAGMDTKDVTDACFALAGAEGERNLERLRKCLLALGFPHEPMLVEDTRSALAAALFGRDGIVVIAGTGSNCLGTKDGRYQRAGGYGALLGDEGSGYRIALDGLTAVLRAFDGRDGPTELREAMLRETGAHTPMDFVSITLGMKRQAIADLAQIVFTVASAGDPTARGILETGAKDLVEMALAVSRRLGMSGAEVVLTGGCFTSSLYVSLFKDQLTHIDPSTSVRTSTRLAAQGAAQLAIDRFTKKN